MIHRSLSLPLLLPFLSLGLSVRTQAEEYTLPEIVTYGETLMREQGPRAIISPAEIERSGARTVGELLKRMAGVDFGANSSGSAYATLRGAPSSQTLVFIDGVRANDPSDPGRAFDFSNLDLSEIESIEILKGPHAVEFGQGAGGGVILIRTRALDERGLRVRGEAGSRASHRASLLAGTPVSKDYSLEAHLSREKTRGFSFKNDELGDPDGREIHSAQLRLRGRPSGQTEFTATSGWGYAKQDIDTTADDPNARTATRSLRNSFSVQHTANPDLTLQLDATRLDVRRLYDDPLNAGTGFQENSLFRGSNDLLNLSARSRLNDALDVVAGANFQRETFQSSSTVYPSSESQTWVTGGYAQALYPLGEALSLEAGLRHDRPEGTASQTVHQLGATWRLASAWTAHARYGTSYRLPTLFQRFDPSSGNPSLRPEKSNSVEAGLSGKPSADFSWTATAFTQSYRELITFLSVAPFSGVNTARARMNGVEASLSRRTGAFTWVPHLTYLDTKDLTNGGELPTRSRWKGGLILQWDPNARWQLEGEALAKSSRRDALATARRARGYALLNAAASYRFTDELKFFARFENLLDRDYEESLGYSTPGFGAFAGLSLSL